MKGFYAKTQDIAAINDLMNALKNLINVVHLRVNKEGIQITEEGCCGEMFLAIKLFAKRFTEYRCDGEYIIAFEPRNMHTILNTHNKRDVLIFEYDEKKEYKLIVKRLTENNSCIEEVFQMDLLKSTPEDVEAEKRGVDYMLVFKTAIFNSIITTLSMFENDFVENWVTVICTNNYIHFEMQNGFVMNHVKHTLYTSKIPEGENHEPRRVQKKRRKNDNLNLVEETEFNNADVDEDENGLYICQEYKLKYLHQILKCFSVTKGGVFVYISEGYPIVFEVEVGSIGTLKCTLMFRDTENEE